MLIHSRRGSLRSPVLAAAFLVRRFGLRVGEALAHFERVQAGAGRLKFVGLGRLPHGAANALRRYEADHALGRTFCGDCFERHRHNSSSSSSSNDDDDRDGGGSRGSPAIVAAKGSDGRSGSSTEGEGGAVAAATAAAVAVARGIGGGRNNAPSSAIEDAVRRLRHGHGGGGGDDDDDPLEELELRGEQLGGGSSSSGSNYSSSSSSSRLRDVERLSAALASTRAPLVVLDLSGTGIGGASVGTGGVICPPPSSPEGAAAVAAVAALCEGVAACRSIEALVLQYARLDDRAVERIAAALLNCDRSKNSRFFNSKRLSTSASVSSVSSASSSSAAPLSPSSALSPASSPTKRRSGAKGGHPMSFLDLSFNECGPNGAEALSAALHLNETLTHLDLQANRVGDAGGLAIARVLCDPDTDMHMRALVEGAAEDIPAAPAAPATTTTTTTTTTTQSSSGGNEAAVEQDATVSATAAGAAAFLARHKRNAGLTYLNLSSNGCGAACMTQFGEVARANPTLVGLEVRSDRSMGRSFDGRNKKNDKRKNHCLTSDCFDLSLSLSLTPYRQI